MSYENKGTITTTVVVSREPDRSGNWVCSGAADHVEIQAAVDYVNALGGGEVKLLEGAYSIDVAITLYSDIVFRGVGNNTHITQTQDNINGIEIIGVSDPHKVNVVIEDLKITGPDSGTGDGIYMEYADYCIVRNVSEELFEYGVYMHQSNYHVIEASTFDDNMDDGIHTSTTGCCCLAYKCECLNNTWAGIRFLGTFNTALGCHVYDNDTGILVSGNNCKVVGCVARFNGNYGISLGTGDLVCVGNVTNYNTIAGIYSSGSITTISGNCCARDGGAPTAAGGYGIYLNGATDVTVNGNQVNHTYSGGSRSGHGIYLTNSSDNNAIVGNTCWDLPADGFGAASGIYIEDSDYNTVIGNDATLCQSYGIEITGTSTGNIVKGNTLQNNVGGPISDGGTNTGLDMEPFQFTEPIGTATIVVASPTGIDVDGDTEGALVWGQIPAGVQQVVRLKVWAVALDAPIGAGGQMHLELTFNAGASNAAYNEAGKSWTIANFDGEEADYVANDVVHWVIEDGDVGNELSNLVAGDSFELLVTHEAGADPDGATDALFRVVEVEYV